MHTHIYAPPPPHEEAKFYTLSKNSPYTLQTLSKIIYYISFYVIFRQYLYRETIWGGRGARVECVAPHFGYVTEDFTDNTTNNTKNHFSRAEHTQTNNIISVQITYKIKSGVLQGMRICIYNVLHDSGWGWCWLYRIRIVSKSTSFYACCRCRYMWNNQKCYFVCRGGGSLIFHCDARTGGGRVPITPIVQPLWRVFERVGFFGLYTHGDTRWALLDSFHNANYGV